MKTTSTTLMKICVSALIMHFPITEIASRAKNICCSSDFKVNIDHVRCQSEAIKHCDERTSRRSSINAAEKNFCMCCGFGRKGRMLPLEISLKSHRDGCFPSLLISGSGSRSQREELRLSRSLFCFIKNLPLALRARENFELDLWASLEKAVLEGQVLQVPVKRSRSRSRTLTRGRASTTEQACSRLLDTPRMTREDKHRIAFCDTF